ncbi:hypothetical protein FACS189456_4570 [Bacteroidia bacterium]|nr:hypothetical protein FACS189456_4570 [Bacteroidia bacterium]
MSSSTHTKEPRRVLSFDYALKRLLRQEANYDILEGFLSEFLGRRIKVKNIPEGGSQQDKLDDKQTRVDILAEDSGELMIIEVQICREMDKNGLTLTCQELTERLLKREYINTTTDGLVQKTDIVKILNSWDSSWSDDYMCRQKCQGIGLQIVNLANFTDVTYNHKASEWIYYLKNNRLKDGFTALGLDKVREILDYDNLSPSEQRSYDKALDDKLGWDSAIKSAEMEGEFRGEAKGKIEGRYEGKTEKEIEVVLNSHRVGIPLETIAQISGLTIDQVKEILAQHNLLKL